jgi:hypothetical protein
VVVAVDEGRFGRHTWCRRRWCPRGKRPPWIVETVYEWVWVYVAVDPLTGRCWSLFLPSMQGEALQVFLDYLHLALSGLRVGVLFDNAPSHKSQQVHWPVGITPLYLPPYSPELDPVEQVFRRFRGALANTRFASQDAMEEALIQELEHLWDDPAAVQQLTAYPWWQAAFPHMIS